MKFSETTMTSSQHGNPRQPVVLVVDDEVDMLVCLGQALSDDGYTVLTSSSAADACDLVRRQKPDLVILDWRLPRAEGAPPNSFAGSEVLSTCRAVDLMLPVVVMSGDEKTEPRSDSLARAADSFIEKPFGMDLIRHHVRFLLERQRRAACLFKLEAYSDIVSLDEMKYLYARSVVAFVGGGISEAARRLGVSRGTLSELMKRFREEEALNPSGSLVMEGAA